MLLLLLLLMMTMTMMKSQRMSWPSEDGWSNPAGDGHLAACPVVAVASGAGHGPDDRFGAQGGPDQGSRTIRGTTGGRRGVPQPRGLRAGNAWNRIRRERSGRMSTGERSTQPMCSGTCRLADSAFFLGILIREPVLLSISFAAANSFCF